MYLFVQGSYSTGKVGKIIEFGGDWTVGEILVGQKN
jgi:hypothetical protein